MKVLSQTSRGAIKERVNSNNHNNNNNNVNFTPWSFFKNYGNWERHVWKNTRKPPQL